MYIRTHLRTYVCMSNVCIWYVYAYVHAYSYMLCTESAAVYAGHHCDGPGPGSFGSLRWAWASELRIPVSEFLFRFWFRALPEPDIQWKPES